MNFRKEKQLVFLDRSADGAVGLPQLLQLARLTKPGRDELVVEEALGLRVQWRVDRSGRLRS